MTVTRELADRLLGTYKRAWEEQDSDLILTIFHPDATYQERALGQPMTGHEQIRRYWIEKVCTEQSDISFEIINSMISGKILVAEWRANFMSSIEGRVDLAEVAIIEVEGEKIRSFREFFDARTEVAEQYKKIAQKYLQMLDQGS
jgi:limonene-1,2-epoxide hydrolase